MAEHKGQVEAGSKESRSHASRAVAPPNAGLAQGSPPSSAFLLQRTLGNRALGQGAGRSAQGGGEFVGSLLQRVATIHPMAGPTTIQRDPFFRTAPRIGATVGQGALQRFKDVKEGEDLSSDDITKATTEKLLQWKARADAEGLDEALVPDSLDLMEIEAELESRSKAEKEKAAQEREKEKQDRIAKDRQDMLARMGVTDAEYVEISRTTTNEKAITKVSAWCTLKKITVTSALDAIRNFGQDERQTAIEVFGRGEVDSVAAVVSMLNNWAALNDRDNINIALLTDLLDKKAMTAGGGIYKVPKLTGTMDIAVPFLSNGTIERRIDPEFHVHYTLRDGPSNAAFKWQRHKKSTGPGTRGTVYGKKETDALLKAAGAIT